MTLDPNHSSLKLAIIAKAFGGAVALRGANVEVHEAIEKLSASAEQSDASEAGPAREGVAAASGVPA